MKIWLIKQFDLFQLSNFYFFQPWTYLNQLQLRNFFYLILSSSCKSYINRMLLKVYLFLTRTEKIQKVTGNVQTLAQDRKMCSINLLSLSAHATNSRWTGLAISIKSKTRAYIFNNIYKCCSIERVDAS